MLRREAFFPGLRVFYGTSATLRTTSTATCCCERLQWPPEQSNESLGKELGFTFAYADTMRMVNTFRAHQLVHWADLLGRQHDLEMALFAAFFTHRRDLFDIEVLADVSAAIGPDGDEARAVLRDQRYAADVRAHQAYWTSRGVRGVPTILFDQRLAVIGAQGIDNYRAVLARMRESATA